MIDTLSVDPVTSVRDLGIHLDSGMSMDTHLSRLVSSCFGVLRQIRCIRRSLPRSSLTTLVAAFILSKVDYCNVVGLLAGRPKRDLDRLQSVISAAARLTTAARIYDHVTLLLKDLSFHWLRVLVAYIQVVRSRLQQCLHGSAPRYLQEVIQPVAEVTSRRRLCGRHLHLPCWCR